MKTNLNCRYLLYKIRKKNISEIFFTTKTGVSDGKT